MNRCNYRQETGVPIPKFVNIRGGAETADAVIRALGE
jgi:hypothetical protein